MYDSPNRYEFLTPVWGQKHLDLYLNVCLPTQLADENIPYFSNRNNDVYRILTTPEDVIILQNHHAIHRLQKFIKVEFVTPLLSHESLPNSIKMARYYEYAIRESVAAGNNSAFVFLTSDSLWSQSTFKYFDRILSSKCRAVCIPHWLRLVTEDVINSIDAQFPINSEGKRNITSIELLRYGMENLHNASKAFFWNDKNPWKQEFPSQFCWLIQDEGILCRCFTFHPLVIWPDKNQTEIIGALDGNFLQLSLTNFNKIHIVQNANEVLGVDLAFRDQKYGESIGAKSCLEVADWIIEGTSDIHLFFSKFIINLSWNKNSDKWIIIKKKSDLLMFWVRCVVFFRRYIYRKRIKTK